MHSLVRLLVRPSLVCLLVQPSTFSQVSLWTRRPAGTIKDVCAGCKKNRFLCSVDSCPVRQAVYTTMYHSHADFQPWDMVIARSKQSAEVVQYVGGNFFTENNLSERNHQ